MSLSHSLKILMFGWEFPPFNSGGLGVACKGLVEALARQGIEVSFVLPKKMDCQSSSCRFIFADSLIKIRKVNFLLSPYLTSKSYQSLRKDKEGLNIYSPDLFGEVARYAREAKKIAFLEDFNLIHAHDWLSFPAGLEAKKASGKPLIVHIHATEFDRTGGNNVNQHVYEIEKQGFSEADKIIAVSNFTKKKVVEYYGIEPDKIEVVHNAIDSADFDFDLSEAERLRIKKLKAKNIKIVLFAGRLTIQKGPDYFLEVAKKVLERNVNVLFIIAGSGDMEAQIIEQAAELNIADKVLFAGFLRGKDLAQAYQMADLFIMPSVSEPFGLTPLESLTCGAPVLISKQSGVSEVIFHCLKTDFWNTDEMADKVLAILGYPELQESLKENGMREVKKFNWQDSAKKCIEIYQEVLSF